MKQVRPKHSTTYRGTKVCIRLVDGTEFFARFRERKATYILFEDHAPVKRASVTLFQPVSWQKRNPQREIQPRFVISKADEAKFSELPARTKAAVLKKLEALRDHPEWARPSDNGL